MKVCLGCGVKFGSDDWECPSSHHRPKIIRGYLAFSPELLRTSNGFKVSYFEQLASVEESNFWFRSRNRLIIWALKKYFPRARNFFEIGCGTGFVLSGIEKTFPDLELNGSDIFITGMDYAAKRISRVELFQMDAMKIPFENEFDVIGAFDVLEHIEDDEAVLRQMYQTVRECGGIILTVPQHPFLWSRPDEYGCHVRRYRAQELRTEVGRAGFEIVKMTSFVSILLPLMIMSRLRKRNLDQDFDPIFELRIGGFLNMALEKVLDLENSMIRLSLSFPVGGPLLLIARRTPCRTS